MLSTNIAASPHLVGRTVVCHSHHNCIRMFCTVSVVNCDYCILIVLMINICDCVFCNIAVYCLIRFIKSCCVERLFNWEMLKYFEFLLIITVNHNTTTGFSLVIKCILLCAAYNNLTWIRSLCLSFVWRSPLQLETHTSQNAITVSACSQIVNIQHFSLFTSNCIKEMCAWFLQCETVEVVNTVFRERGNNEQNSDDASTAVFLKWRNTVTLKSVS